jgi:bacillithiol biosynthesis cysteine-adding enzyme BshC
VPVFWLQTEDHDVVEIAEVALPGRDGQRVTIGLPVSAENRVSIAHLTLPTEIVGCLSALAAELRGHIHADSHLDRLARHYRPGVRYADAFAGVLAELFAPEGLVFLDPRDRALAAAARPVHARALTRCGAIATALEERSRALGDRAQVHVRPGAPLSYVHPDGPEGPRFRLEPAGPDRFALVRGGREHGRDELLANLDSEPRCVSSSALLRPIIQDSLLRTAAYVGGPAEVAYFAQIEPLWSIFDLPVPKVMRRSSFRLVPAGVRHKLERMGLEPADIAGKDEDALLLHEQPAAVRASDVTRRLLDPFETALAGLAPELFAGPQLARAAERSRRLVARSVERLARKIESAALHRDAERVDRLRRLRLILHPGAPQERAYGLSWFAARSGDRDVVERVLAAVDVADPTLKDIDLP